MSRGEFWKVYFLLAIPDFFVGIFARIVVSQFLAWLLFSMICFLSTLIVFQVFKRLRDVGKPWWISLLLFLPFVNLYVIYLLFIKKGS